MGDYSQTDFFISSFHSFACKNYESVLVFQNTESIQIDIKRADAVFLDCDKS